jgi:hypothetical protein
MAFEVEATGKGRVAAQDRLRSGSDEKDQQNVGRKAAARRATHANETRRALPPPFARSRRLLRRDARLLHASLPTAAVDAPCSRPRPSRRRANVQIRPALVTRNGQQVRWRRLGAVSRVETARAGRGRGVGNLAVVGGGRGVLRGETVVVSLRGVVRRSLLRV